jgi:hypothetical protein
MDDKDGSMSASSIARSYFSKSRKNQLYTIAELMLIHEW